MVAICIRYGASRIIRSNVALIVSPGLFLLRRISKTLLENRTFAKPSDGACSGDNFAPPVTSVACQQLPFFNFSLV